jgi:hypothetical protein
MSAEMAVPASYQGGPPRAPVTKKNATSAMARAAPTEDGPASGAAGSGAGASAASRSLSSRAAVARAATAAPTAMACPASVVSTRCGMASACSTKDHASTRAGSAATRMITSLLSTLRV